VQRGQLNLIRSLAVGALFAALLAWLYLGRDPQAGERARTPEIALGSEKPAAVPARKPSATPEKPGPAPALRNPRQLDPVFQGDTAPPDLPAGYLEPLQYPEGHPCAGQYRVGVTAREVNEAVARAIGALAEGDPGMDVPLLALVDVKISLADARRLTPGLDWGDVDDRVRIYERLRDSEFVNPDAPPRTYIFQAPPGHAEAITRASLLRVRVTQREIDALDQRPGGCEPEGAGP
jgi:hypothetical protein